jgi:hypothetical protein
LALKGIKDPLSPYEAIKKVGESGIELALSPHQAIKMLGESGIELSPEQQLIMEDISKEFIDLAKKNTGKRDRAKLIKQFAKRVLEELSLANAIGIASYSEIYVIAVLLFTFLAATIKANEREVTRKLEDTLQRQPATEQQEQKLSELKAPKLPARLESEISKIKTIEEFQNAQAMLGKRGRELGYQEPSITEQLEHEVRKQQSKEEQTNIAEARMPEVTERHASPFKQILSCIPKVDDYKQLRIVELRVDEQKEQIKKLLQARGEKVPLHISLTVKQEQNGNKERFYENWTGGGKYVGETLPEDYDLSDKKVSLRAQEKINEQVRKEKLSS